MPDSKELWNLKFSVEVSTRYHDWRRAMLGTYVDLVRIITLLGAGLSLMGLVAKEQWTVAIAVSCAVIAVVTLADIGFGLDEKARRHTDIYRRFKSLQSDMARHQSDWETKLAEWEAQAQEIRQDEPAVLWALYVRSWNQTILRHNADSAFRRQIRWWHLLLGRFFRFRPESFPFIRA